MAHSFFRIFIMLCLAMLIATPAKATETLRCAPTPPGMGSAFYPGAEKVVKSNNLRRMTGHADLAEGIPVIVSGIVRDKHCVPIEGAVVDIWQANSFGRYHHAKANKKFTLDPHFAGSGRAVTDNNGRYSFITIYPGDYGKDAPHIHVRVRAKGMKTLTTVVYPADSAAIASDGKVNSFPPAKYEALVHMPLPRDRNDVMQGLELDFPITLQNIQDFREF